MEVEHVRLSIIVPHRRLVVQLNDALRALALPPGQQGLMVLGIRDSRPKPGIPPEDRHAALEKLRCPPHNNTILTFRGLMDTLSFSMFIPGIMMLIFRGPLKPKTLVS